MLKTLPSRLNSMLNLNNISCVRAIFLYFFVSTHNVLHLYLVQHSFSFEEQTAEWNDNLTSLKMHSNSGALEASISK